ncbi:hypothetical protein O3P69_013034 [Scylla paramamosain]|uniref:C2H2-type domain-containing protein n=1 Tax=Scylla paramamosain TaxID=85552 RepID=A0AAW0TT30_SCYPA
MGKEEEVEEVIKKEIEEEEEIIEDEELIEENERILKDGEQEKEEEEEEETVEEEEVGEEERLRSRVNSLLEEQQTQPDLEECGRESESRGAHTMQGDAGLGRGARWRCRVCAAVFSSQQEHDTHKTAMHPGSVRAKRGTTRPAAPHQPSRRGRPVDGDHQDHERPAVACQEGAIVILEGDGQGGVTHHRLQPSAITEDLQGPAQQNTLPLTGGAVSLPCPVCTEVQGPGNGVVLVECPLCGRRLAGSPALQHHMARVHHHPSHPPLRYRCRLCLCQCHTRPQLERHMRERHGAPPPPPPVQCGRCGKTYSARYIDSHLANMHGDVTRFPCAFCPMKFGTRTGLRAHVSLEHANTTWACQECPLQFAKYHQLRQHRLYVHSHAEHRCPLCPRSFKRRCDLTEHTKRRHQERQPQECSFCPKVYSDRKRLRIHLMRKHGVAWEDTLARGYARRQRENNCLRRRHHQQHQHPHSPQEEKQQAPREDSEGCQGGMLEGQPEYSVVHLTEAPHPLADTISYIILEET